MVSIFLDVVSGPKIKAKYAFVIRDVKGRVPANKLHDKYQMLGEEYHGWENLVEYSRIKGSSFKKVLFEGTLTVEVRIKPHEDYTCTNFIPSNLFLNNMSRAFMNKAATDILFEVKSKEDHNKLVLQFCAKGSTLATLCQDYDKPSTLPLEGIQPGVFRRMLKYVYGRSIGIAEWKGHSKDFIDAADRFGLKNLKIEAEAWYVKFLKITVENVIDELIYADRMHCFLLKETAIIFILKNSEAVFASKSFENNMPESWSIVREIISVAIYMNRIEAGDKSLKDVAKLSINELRAQLHAENTLMDLGMH
ncbi:hypothetical protein ACHAWF_009488 [Thalassiosira exigua]